jgi:hypothetical protein
MPLQNQKNIIVKHLIEMKFVASRQDRGIVAIVQLTPVHWQFFKKIFKNDPCATR